MYKARVFFDTAEDDYNEGEKIDGSGTDWTDSVKAASVAELKQKLVDLIGVDDFEHEDVNEYPTASEYWTGYLADENNAHATEQDMALWKQGKRKLWRVNCHILVSKITEAKATLDEKVVA